MFILGSCKALNLEYSGCCLTALSPSCKNEVCYCDFQCHANEDCCSDIADIGCIPPRNKNETLGKTKSDDDTIN